MSAARPRGVLRSGRARPRLVKRLVPSARLRLVVRVGAVFAAFVVGAVFLTVAGHDVGSVYGAMWLGSFGSAYGQAETLVAATPLVFTGLAVAIAFRMRLWNIGAEGQFYLGAFGATAVAYGWPRGPGFLLLNLLTLAAYVLPWMVAAYYLMKAREIAA